MKILKQPRIAAAALAAMVLGAAGPAGAQQQPIMAFTTANVIEALTALGVTNAQAQRSTGPSGAPVDYVGFAAGNVRHVAILEVCNAGAPGCLGLNLLTIWSDAGAVVDRNRVNEFNAAYSFGKGIVAGNALIFQRYTISDGGVSRANVQSNISNFVGLSNTFAGFVGGTGAPGTISAKPGEASLSRTGLSAESAAVIESLGAINPNHWNAERSPVSIDAGAHAHRK